MVQTLDPRQALQPVFLEGVINKKLEQQLDFLNMFPRVRTDALSFSYFEDTTNAGADISAGTMGTPSPLMEVGELDEIEVSRISMKHGAMERFGYALKFSQRQLREEAVIDEINRAVDRATFGIAKKMNDDIVNAIKNVSNDVTEVGGSAVWSEDEASPVEDLLSFMEASMVEGYPYMMNNIFLHKTNYFELLKYIQGVDINWVRSPFGGMAEIPEINGMKVHNLHSTQLDEGGYIGTDDRFPGITVYEYLDPKHSTIEGGMVNVNRYEEERFPYNIVVELYAERGIATKLPNALYYKATGI
jgi:hypothetical protein